MLCSRLVVVAVVLSLTGAACGEWIQWPAAEGGNGHWYRLTEAERTWAEAEAEAVAAGGHLATINNADENQWVYDTFSPTFGPVGKAWIGFFQDQDDSNYSEPRNGWKWVGAPDLCSWETGNPGVCYTNWRTPEPNNNGDEDFVEMLVFAPGKWNDVPVDGNLGSGIIERETPPGPPTVTNVTASQRTDSMFVDIGYDLADAGGDPCMVSVLVSDDGGSSWDVPATSFTGDIGAGITPGTGKAIVWDCGADLPGTFGTTYVVRVCADDGHTSPGMVSIPGGEFQMGDHHDGMSYALPVHAVYVDSFYMDVYEVTNAQYAAGLNWAIAQDPPLIDDPSTHGGVVQDSTTGTAFCDTTTSSPYSRITWDGSSFGVTVGKEDHPMLQVSWYGSVAYANWRSAMDGLTPSYDLSTWECNFSATGYRLPTEAEWEYAARGGEYTTYFRYPWGDTLDGSKANYSGSGDPYESGDYPRTTPVGYYDGSQTPPGVDMANGYGLYDMAGNVWEWCNDRYGSYAHCDPAPCDNPHGPASGSSRVLRGGSWDNYDGILRCAHRGIDYPVYRDYYLGFRLLLD